MNDELSERIVAYVTNRGYEWPIVAAAQMCADSRLILAKIRSFVEDDGEISWDNLAEHVDESGWSSGEKAMVRIACSLAGYAPEPTPRSWLLANTLTPLDQVNGRIVSEALRFAIFGPAGRW